VRSVGSPREARHSAAPTGQDVIAWGNAPGNPSKNIFSLSAACGGEGRGEVVPISVFHRGEKILSGTRRYQAVPAGTMRYDLAAIL